MYVIQVNINGASHKKSIPQNWEEVQFVDFVNAIAEDKRENVNGVLSALTGIPQDVLEALQPYDRRFIETQCSFFWNTAPKKQGLPSDFVQVQIETDTWQKLIDCEQEFKRVADLDLPEIAAAQMIVNTYAGVDLKAMKVPEALSYWDFFFSNSLIGKRDGKTCIRANQMRTRLQQVLRESNPLVGLRLFTHFQREMSRNSTRFLTRKPMSSTQLYYLKRNRLIMPKIYASTMSLSTTITANESTNSKGFQTN